MTKFCRWVDIHDLITYATSGDDRLRGLGVALGRISRFSIDLRHRPYNTLALPCECVISHTKASLGSRDPFQLFGLFSIL